MDDVKPIIKMEIDDKPLVVKEESDVKPTLGVKKEEGTESGPPTTNIGKFVYARKQPAHEANSDSESGEEDSRKEVEENKVPKIPGQHGVETRRQYADYWYPEELSEDITNKLHDALRDDDAFATSWLYKRQYEAAPNPIIHLETVGYVGLPLSDEVGTGLLGHSGTIVKPEAKHETSASQPPVVLDTSKVQFQNPGWNKFLAKVTQQACSSLGAGGKKKKIACALSQILIYTPGSGGHIVITSQDARSFGTLALILPSTCKKLVVEASYHDLPTKLQLGGAQGVHAMEAIASLHGVTLKLEPLTSGYQLVLLFALVDMSPLPLPNLNPSLGSKIAALREAFSIWKSTEPVPTAKVVYKLKHRYTLAGLVLHSLKSDDHSRVMLVASIAAEYDLQVGLGMIETIHEGSLASGDDLGGWSYSEWPHMPNPEMDDYRSQQLPTVIKDLRTLDGALISEDVNYDEEEVLNSDENGHGGEPAATELGDCYTQWFREPILVIWPASKLPELTYGAAYPAHALKTLGASHSEKPDAEEQVLLDYLLALKPEILLDTSGAEGILSRAACRWRNEPLWHHSMTLRTGNLRVKVEHCCLGVRTFGYEAALLPYIKRLLNRGNGNEFRLRFLDDTERELSDCDADSTAWIQSERQTMLRDLAPIERCSWNAKSRAELPLLIQAAKHYGGASYLRDVILPQLDASLLAADYVEFAELVLEHFPEDPHGSDLVTHLKSKIRLDTRVGVDDAVKLIIQLVGHPAVGGAGQWLDVLSRLIKPPGDNEETLKELHRSVMDTLMPKLNDFVSRNAFDPPIGPLATFLKHYVSTQLENVEERKPAKDVMEAIPAQDNPDCICGRCTEVAKLFASTKWVLSLEQFSNAKVACVNNSLRKAKACGLATTAHLPKRLRGIRVSRLPPSRDYEEWLLLKDKLHTFLRTLRPHDHALKAMIGQADYSKSLSILDVQSIHKNDAPDAADERTTKRRKVVVDLASP